MQERRDISRNGTQRQKLQNIIKSGKNDDFAKFGNKLKAGDNEAKETSKSHNVKFLKFFQPLVIAIEQRSVYFEPPEAITFVFYVRPLIGMILKRDKVSRIYVFFSTRTRYRVLQNYKYRSFVIVDRLVLRESLSQRHRHLIQFSKEVVTKR